MSDAAVTECNGLTRLLVMRHGETEWNAQGRMQGQLDVHLNCAGKRQATEAAEALRLQGLADQIDTIVSSDLSRASETADAIARVCPRAKRVVDPGLREINTGIFQGKLLSECGTRKNRVAEAWCSGNFSQAYPGDQGESAAQVIARGMASLQRAAAMGQCVLVVSHGGCIKWCAVNIELGVHAPSRRSMLLQNVDDVLHAPLQNCCCSTLVYEHSRGTFRCERWFDALTTSEARDDTG